MSERDATQADLARRAELAANLAEVRSRLAAACHASGRGPAEVTLVAVSKTWPIADIRTLADLGATEVGENRVQEAEPKARALPELTWHFVGGLQLNKARRVAGFADVVESVDREELIAPLSTAALARHRPLEVLLQVSLDGDPHRGGVVEANLHRLAAGVADAPALVLRGLMAIAPLGASPRPAFDRLVALADAVRRDHPNATVISAGMSADLEDAVAAGATLVRVGSALFGRRGPVVG